ncbi:hypothetical protein ISN44_As06g024630 [Arabidopsis suecica]|uniref:DUF569 domain-containing protein n=1 Tax=Arabidopsis suecica TaxID=45249 RepID=A0A8T2CKW5_ARASU|nr:hypothetical protein ISN44_As06g024630 [Arabidopsis suecica]KAG7598173.1 hypothetical protein ISN44_As06g024630 [Arabidopsis suecica]
MELFTKGNNVKLRSHLDKFLVADDDQETIRQSRKGDSRRAVWTVEPVVDKPNLIRLKSSHGTYLTASNKPLLLGMTGEKVTQTASFNKLMDWQTQWEPERDGFQVKLKSWCGKWMRANGGTPPWRNSVTHDEPHTSKTKNWLIWDVITLDGSDLENMSDGDESSVSSPVGSEFGSEPGSPAHGGSTKSSISRFASLGLPMSPRWSSKPKSTTSSFNQKETTVSVSAMEFFQKAKAIRMRNSHNKYLTADDDEETITQNRNGSTKNARWIVEPVRDSFHVIRLKSCYGKYLTASNERFLLGATGKKVIQLKLSRLDSSVEWEPLREGSKIKLRTRSGNFLRANGGLPPWRNSVTHDVPHLSATQDSISWDVDVVEILTDSEFKTESPKAPPKTTSPPPHRRPTNSPLSAESPRTSSSLSDRSDSDSVESPPKSDGRTIHYHIADEEGHVEDETTVGYAFTFKGNSVAELTQTLREETCMEDAVVCTRSQINGKLFPLRLQLPPNNGTLHVVVLPSSASL